MEPGPLRSQPDEQKEGSFLSPEEEPARTPSATTLENDPQELVKQGLSFFSGLAKVLQCPDKTKELVDTLVRTDKETGETVLHIPVPDKESVTGILNAIGKIFTGK